ncbi:MAG: cysteine desulfurase-like protein, partial [Rhodothermales bacterium]
MVELSSMRIASPAQIRSHFPALERRHGGYPVAYFDGPGGTQVPRVVVEAMADYLYHHNANTHWAYPTSAETDVILDHARHAFADFFNASPDEVVFGANMTTLTFHLARTLGRRWGPGDEIVVTELDHHANIDTWKALVPERGVTVRIARMNPETGQLDENHLDSLLNRHTRLLAIGAASNALGTINNIARAAEKTHALGALVFVDAVHYAPHALVDVQALGCDFLACSAYKFYGPHAGVLFGKKNLLAALSFPRLRPAADTPPEHAETGTQNHEAIAGAAAAVDFLASLADGPTRRTRLHTTYEALHARGMQLVRRLWNGLA